MVILAAAVLALPVAAYEGEPIHTVKQEVLHQCADLLRWEGYPEDHELIRMLSAEWWEEEEALNILAKTCANEAAGVPGAQWCPVWHQCAVMQGIVNRTRLPGFPDTVRGVVSQVLPSGYYAYNPAYCEGFDGIDRHYYELAKLVLDGDAAEMYEIPEDIVFHDNQPHGEVWKTSWIDTGWYRSMTYFCR